MGVTWGHTHCREGCAHLHPMTGSIRASIQWVACDAAAVRVRQQTSNDARNEERYAKLPSFCDGIGKIGDMPEPEQDSRASSAHVDRDGHHNKGTVHDNAHVVGPNDW